MKSRRLPILMAEPGMTIAQDVYTADNRLVIPKDTVITDKIITKLKYYNISYIDIVIPETSIKIHNSEKIKSSKEFKQFNNKYETVTGNLRIQLNALISGEKDIDEGSLLGQVKNILKESRNGMHLFDILHCLPQSDDMIYIHSLNVALICNVLGHWLKLPEEDINTLTISGLLMDIGKLLLPPEIMYKKSTLTESEYGIVKTHPIRGYQLLSKKNLDSHIKNVVLMHHERCDGSGYPGGLRNSQIDSFAKIVAIADVYDAMTSTRVYRPALSPFEVISTFESEGLQKYDPRYIMTFLEEMVQSYVGNRVRLNNKQEGEIIMINKRILSRPIIQTGETFIDLSKDYKLSIEAIL